MRRIGIYPGTFDPVHAGHLAFAEAAARACRLEEVILLPEALPRGKSGVSSLEHRLALISLAVQGHDRLRGTTLHSSRFTVAETWPEIRQAFPGTSITLLIGSDVVGSLASWEGLGAILPEVSFAIGLRHGHNERTITDAVADIVQKYGQQLELSIVRTPQAVVASSQIRSGRLDWLPNKTMAQYIARHRLYS